MFDSKRLQQACFLRTTAEQRASRFEPCACSLTVSVATKAQGQSQLSQPLTAIAIQLNTLHSLFQQGIVLSVLCVTGVLLLVDSVEGPMPQTRFVTKKALALNKKVSSTNSACLPSSSMKHRTSVFC